MLMEKNLSKNVSAFFLLCISKSPFYHLKVLENSQNLHQRVSSKALYFSKIRGLIFYDHVYTYKFPYFVSVDENHHLPFTFWKTRLCSEFFKATYITKSKLKRLWLRNLQIYVNRKKLICLLLSKAVSTNCNFR